LVASCPEKAKLDPAREIVYASPTEPSLANPTLMTIRSIRTIWRLRQRWASEAAHSIEQLQKALTLMNVQLANSISDLSGQTGMAILRAIVEGERNPWVLAKLRDPRIQASEDEIAHSLRGNWREDVLFELGQMLEAYNFQIRQIEKCDLQLEKYMKAQPTRPPVRSTPAQVAEGGEGTQKSRKPKARHTKPPRKNRIGFDAEKELARVMGADLTRIDGIKVMPIQTIYSELGPDLSAFPSENHFASWLMLAPKRDVSGGRVIRHLWVKGRNRVADALRMAAESLKDSHGYLGARYRSLRGRLGAPKAIKAMARYLACLVYRTLMKGQDWVDRGASYYEQRRQQRELMHLQRKAKTLGLQLVPAQ
jgi:transposase